MKAIICRELGGLDKLSFEDIDEPTAGPGEVVVAVKVAGLNFFDALMIAGKYQYKSALPFSPGAEGAGVIEAVGDGVSGFRVGERVAAYLNNFCREKTAVPVSRLLPIPDDITDEQAATLVVTYGMSLHALKDRAALRAGETLAVLGAAGGAGLAAVELGKSMGAKVIACVSSSEKMALAEKHGADGALNYAKEDLREGLRRLTKGEGVNVVYDPVGGDYSEPALRSLAWGGRFLIVGFASGTIPKIPLNLPLLKSCDIQGVFWTPFLERNPAGYRVNMEQVFSWTKQGKLSAHVDRIFRLAETAKALGLLIDRKAQGKVLVRI
ncbi:MAG: NADPH:quinone reductase [Variibacter sp.]|nr:NADPH:quinone reductase [Variibacter sp.]